MTDYKKQFPELRQFLGGYFHQDWKYVYDWGGKEPSFEAIVRHFKAENPPNYVTQATAELEQLLKLPLDEDQLNEIVGKLGSDYYPPGSGMTFRQWLEIVLGVLKEPPEKAQPMRVIG